MRLLQLALFAASAIGVTAADAAAESTTFGGVSVPPMLELSPKTYSEEINSTKFMVVKHYRYEIMPRAAEHPTN